MNAARSRAAASGARPRRLGEGDLALAEGAIDVERLVPRLGDRGEVGLHRARRRRGPPVRSGPEPVPIARALASACAASGP